MWIISLASAQPSCPKPSSFSVDLQKVRWRLLPYLYFAYSAASQHDDASLCVPPRGTPIATYASPTSRVV
jgi:hypothetical protein